MKQNTLADSMVRLQILVMGENQPPSDQSPSETAAALKFREAGGAGNVLPNAPILRRLLAYWQSKCGPDGRLPSRADIDPLDLRSMLPNIYLIDVLPDGKFRLRLLGEAHVAVYGHGLVGRIIDDDRDRFDDSGDRLDRNRDRCRRSTPVHEPSVHLETGLATSGRRGRGVVMITFTRKATNGNSLACAEQHRCSRWRWPCLQYRSGQD